MATKNFVLDTNVLLFDPNSIFNFQENNVILPITVIEEIDKFKKAQEEIGYNARQVSRTLDELREQGSLVKGVPLSTGGTLTVSIFNQEVANMLPFGDMKEMDDRILATALYVAKNDPHTETILVTMDSNVRIKADVQGLAAKEYEHGKVKTDEFYTGISELVISSDDLDSLYRDKKILLKNISTDELDVVPFPNQCFVITDYSGNKSALTKYNVDEKCFKLITTDYNVMGVEPRNKEQHFAMGMLNDLNINLVTITGKAGCGKTLLALAAGLHNVELGLYNRVMLLKPIVPMDNSHELGFMPGTMIEKLAPWMSSYTDNIQFIMSDYGKEEEPQPRKKRSRSNKPNSNQNNQNNQNEKQAGKTNPALELMELGILEMGSLENIRGRSLPNQYIIIDECQNLTPHAIKTIITRAGMGSKIVLLGDISQIDSPYLDATNNGLVHAIERFKEQKISAHITMKKSERSELAELAAELL